jgi:acyl dehydratase
LLRTIDKTNGSILGLHQDSSGNYYFRDNATTSNISRELFNEMITRAPHRFNDMTLYAYNAGINDGFYRLPILAGDTLSYKITIVSAAGQAAAVPTGRTSMDSRTYTVTLNII